MNSKLRIIHIASLIEPIDEKAPGGAELGVYRVSAYQAKAGYDVKVFALEGSKLADGVEHLSVTASPKIVPVRTTGEDELSEAALSKRFEIEEQVFGKIENYLSANKNEIDLIHNHAFDYYPLFKLAKLGIPILHKLHLPPIVPWINQGLSENYGKYQNAKFVTVSKSCAKDYAQVAGVSPEVVYNGIELNNVKCSAKKGENFLFVGRISPEKGLHTAIDLVVDQKKMQLDIVGRVYDEDYFAKEIEPRLANPLINYHGFLSNFEVLAAMRKAKALVFPIEWEEPFGLVLIEAMASGTPVVAFAKNSTKEIVENGTSGFLVETKEQMSETLDRVFELSPQQCRKSAEKFSFQAMIDKYDVIYKQLIECRQAAKE